MMFATVASAQFTKGTRMVGVSLGSAFFNSGKKEFSVPAPTTGYTSSINSYGFGISPSMGWFISSDMVVGARVMLGYNYDKTIDADNNVTFRKNIRTSFTGSIGGFARKYFGTDGFMPFAQVHADAGSGTSHTEGFLYTTVYKEIYTGKSSGDFSADGGLSVGVTKLLNDHVGLEIAAGYLYSYNKNKFKTTTSRDIDRNGTIDEEGISQLTTKYTNHGASISIGLQVFLNRR